MRKDDERHLAERAEREDGPRILAVKHVREYRACWSRLLRFYGREAIARVRANDLVRGDIGSLDYEAHSASLDLHHLSQCIPMSLRHPPDPDDPDDLGIRNFEPGPRVAHFPGLEELSEARQDTLDWWARETEAVGKWDGRKPRIRPVHPASLTRPSQEHSRAILIVDLAASTTDLLADLRVLRADAGIRFRVPAGKRDLDAWKEDFGVLRRSWSPGTKWDIAREVLPRYVDRESAEAAVRSALRRASALVSEVRPQFCGIIRILRRRTSPRSPSRSKLFFATRHPKRHA